VTPASQAGAGLGSQQLVQNRAQANINFILINISVKQKTAFLQFFIFSYLF
jgi:hypothetical protein